MIHEIFRKALATRYQAVKSQYPTEGRRKWRLRVLYDSWPSFTSDNNVSEGGQADSEASVRRQLILTASPRILDLKDTKYETDPDPLDSLLEDEELGLIIRTDFSNDDAWDTFCQKVQEAQKDLLSDLYNGEAQAPETSAAAGGDVPMVDASATTASTNVDADDSDSSSEAAAEIVKILDPSDPADRLRLTNISNLMALRLFNDVDVRPAPVPPAKRISPPNPLIDQGGWQEVYRGKNLWIYDTKSISDECVRVVSQEGDFYGTASGDSWRARGTHVPELQFNMTYQGMKIDFNGLDKWDWTERARNLKDYNIL